MTDVVDFRVRLPADLRPAEMSHPRMFQQYDAVLNLTEKHKAKLDDLNHQMEECGIDHAVVHAEFEAGDPADALNESVAELIAASPKRFSGFGTISTAPLEIMRAISQVDRVKALGLSGLCIQPSFFDMAIDDRRLYPIYARACSNELPVAIHTGVNYSRVHPLKNEHPLLLDQVACDFPDLTLIASHGGWPWTADMAAVARKHPTVFIEFGGWAPRYIDMAGAGWDVLRSLMSNVLKQQILFGTNWPTMGIDRAVNEWRSVDLKEEVRAALMGGNARRLLKHATI